MHIITLLFGFFLFFLTYMGSIFEAFKMDLINKAREWKLIVIENLKFPLDHEKYSEQIFIAFFIDRSREIMRR